MRRILLVLNELGRTAELRSELAARGAEVSSVASVDEALALDPGTHDVVVVDLHLPRTSALVLAHHLRERAPHARVYSIALTRFDMPEVRRITHEAGFHVCLPAAMPAGDLAEAILQGGST